MEGKTNPNGEVKNIFVSGPIPRKRGRSRSQHPCSNFREKAEPRLPRVERVCWRARDSGGAQRGARPSRRFGIGIMASRRSTTWSLFALLFVAFCAASATAQATGEPCQTRSIPVGVSIVEASSERETSRTYVGLLAFFGSTVDEGPKGSGDPIPLVVASDRNACEPIAEVAGKAVLLWRGECAYIEKAINAQDAGAAAVIVVSDEEELSPMSCAGDSIVSIPVMQVLEEDGAQLEQDIAAGAVTVALTELKLKGTVDLTASTALLAMASLTIVFGAVWSLSDQMVHFKKDETESDRGAGRAEAARGSGLEGLEITESSAAYFVVFASVVLLIIFFTMQHWVFIIIKGVFCFAAVQGLTALFFAAIDSSFKSMSQDINLPVFGTVNAVSVPSVGLAVATVLVWLLNQGADWAWVLQDIMGMSFLVNVLRLVHLPNLKVGSMLLMGAMCYDIFWVYVQPHLFGNESVMVKVAKGGEKHESLPMLFLFPRLGGSAGDFSMLGYGDVILPGLLIVHNHLFDNRKVVPGRPRVNYLVPSIAAYIAGLLLTFMALYFEVGGQGGQPALCYLVPTVLGGTVGYAHCRGELKEMWRGGDLYDENGEDEGERLIGTGSTNSTAVNV
jgi:signal peptide peptidase-like 2B